MGKVCRLKQIHRRIFIPPQKLLIFGQIFDAMKNIIRVWVFV